MEENRYKRLSNPEIEDFYSRAVVQLEPALAQMLTRAIVEIIDRRQEEDDLNKEHLSIYIPDEQELANAHRRAHQKDLFDSLGYIPKDCIVCVKEDEI